MLATVFEVEMKKIMIDVRDRSKQQYLDKRISKPKPSELKLGLLYLLLYSKSYTIEDIRSICSATGLIQMGLDIHDWVTNEPLNTPKKAEIRQLQVLAGDYFSSQYYRLLALLGDANAIQMIAQSVRKINQQKVIYYQQIEKVNNNFEQWLNLKTEIEFGIFYGFLSNEDQQWMNLIELFIQLDLLLQAEESGLWNRGYLKHRFQITVNEIRDNIKKIKFIEVINELQKYLKHYEQISATNLVAEEI